MTDKFGTIDEYIGSFPPDVQKKLTGVRITIHHAAPDAQEAIRYGIPTFRLNDTNLVHFAAFKDHLSFFPTSSGVEQFKHELSQFKMSKGTIQIPFDIEVPYDLIAQITKFRVDEINHQKKFR